MTLSIAWKSPLELTIDIVDRADHRGCLYELTELLVLTELAELTLLTRVDAGRHHVINFTVASQGGSDMTSLHSKGCMINT